MKYEEVYLKSYETFKEARDGLARYFHFYSTERLHESLGYRTPKEVYFGMRCEPVTAQANSLHPIEACFVS